MSRLRVLEGRLSYRRRSTGEERGREDFALSRNRDGSRTLRCFARTDDSRFVRDAVSTIDPEGRPIDCFVRLQLASRWIGSGYLRTVDNRLRVTVDAADTGPVDQEENVPARFHIVTHAVMLDGWSFWSYDHRHGGEQSLVVYNTSTRWDGTDGPAGKLESLEAVLQGEEEVEVPAGRFQARRYRLWSETIGSPPATLWVHGDDHLLVRYDWPGLDLEYVLSTLRDGD